MSFIRCSPIQFEDKSTDEILHHRSKRDLTLDEETLRNIIKNGIPALNITFDPILLPGSHDVNVTPAPGVAVFNELNLNNVTISGLSEFISNGEMKTSTNTDLQLMTLEFDLSFFLQVHADYIKFDSLLGDTITLYGDGTLQLDIENLRISGTTEIDLNTPVSIKTLNVDVSIEKTTYDISNIMNMGGTSYAEIYNNLLSETTPEILTYSVDSVVATIKDLFNAFMKDNNISSDDLFVSKSI
ncbi:hypothetical protein L9F63_017612 [Diploptera punctata]|uniref:Uncharacterized protein n=1 Tax=Diploptera punctata TaxID=6984 RepID=A0AAD8EG45_DIPPU|nr:hypothetical protein L9F63_017612 [Diploptera punctata]